MQYCLLYARQGMFTPYNAVHVYCIQCTFTVCSTCLLYAVHAYCMKCLFTVCNTSLLYAMQYMFTVCNTVHVYYLKYRASLLYVCIVLHTVTVQEIMYAIQYKNLTTKYSAIRYIVLYAVYVYFHLLKSCATCIRNTMRRILYILQCIIYMRL